MRTFRLLGLVLITMLVSINFAACSDGNEQDDLSPDKNPTITIDSSIITNGLAFAAEGSIKSVSFTTNTDWTLNIASTTGGSTWCMASVTSGKKGEASVEFTTLDNSDYDDRSVSVTIKAGTASQTFTITQKCKEAILLTADKFEIVQEGGSITVEVKSNIDYQMEISESAKSWITETTTRALTTHNHTFSVAANEEYEKREGEIFFKKGEHIETVRVYQAGGAVIVLTKEKYEVSDKGETITVEIKSNVEYGIKMPQVDWIYDEASARGASSHTLKYVINPNETYDSRSAQIIYFDKNNTASADTLTIIQVQKDAIVIANNEYTIDAKEQTIEVELSSNIDYTISIADDGKDWISRVENTRSLTTKKIKFNIAENTSDDSRTSHITFASGNGVSQNIEIIQQGALPVIHVETAGTLSGLIDSSVKDEITKLKITGKLNSTDMEFLRKMKKIQVLDLSEVNMASPWESAFQDCKSLVSITLPDSMTSLGNYAFDGCKGLIAINASKNNSNYTSLDGVLYDKNGTTLIQCPEGKASITIPEQVSSIADAAFSRCTNLTSMIIPNGVTNIGSGAFSNCISLTSITIPNSVTSIGDYIFQWCVELKSITIPTNLKSISRFAFLSCWKLSSVTISDGVTRINEGAFAACKSLVSITIPGSVTNISENAMSGNQNLTSINVDKDNSKYLSIDGVLYDKDASILMQCPGGKTSITIPNTVEAIGAGAFFGCINLTSITIPNSVTSIGEGAFQGCRNLTSMVIPSSVINISGNAFSTCESLVSITIPNSVTCIESHLFDGCTSLTTLTIPNNVISIKECAFWNCSGLVSITIPNSVTRIERQAFEACTNLTSVTIPNSVRYWGGYVFWECSNISEIHLGYEYVSGMDPYLFSSVDKRTCVLYVPRGCEYDYRYADGWKNFKNIVEE